MKNLSRLSLAVLLAACSESTTPVSPSLAELEPRGVWTGATFGFDGAAAAETGYSVSPSRFETSPSGEVFLGRFTNETVTLQVPAGASSLQLGLTLYIIGSWDGYGGRRYGEDTWNISAFCGSTLLKSFTTDFSNKVTTKQHFPNPQSGALNPGLTGATRDLLEYDGVLTVTKGKGSAADATYQIAFSLENVSCSGPVDFVFSSPSQGLQAVADESWGLDNIVVTGS